MLNRCPRLPIVVLIVLLASSAAPARASSDVRIQFAALQRLLAEQVFSQEGRRYVKGSRVTKCNFGYLEHPVVDAQDGRLRVRARFTGKSALNVFGACVGMGDSFDVVITARPEYRSGAIKLADVKAQSETHSYYADRVCRALTESLPAQFAYPVLDEARRAIEQPVTPGYARKVTRLEVHAVSITPDALVLSMEIDITVG